MTANLSFFGSIRADRPDRSMSLVEVYQLVTSCPKLRRETERILQQHRAGIIAGWEGHDKGSYQADKVNSLPAITAAGVIDDKSLPVERLRFRPSGLLALDIDENTPDRLRDFYTQVSEGRIPYAAFAARSVSGALNGAFTLFVKVEYPTSLKRLSTRLKSLCGIAPREAEPAALNKLNAAYHKAFAYLLQRDAAITAGKAGQHLKSLRYLASDPQAYLNELAQPFGLARLEAILRQIEAAEEIAGYAVDALEIETTDAIDFAEQFAAAKGYRLVDGQKHEYLNRFAIACNLLGVPQSDAEAYAAGKGVRVRSNCIAYPYRRYKESFGRWANKLAGANKPRIVRGQAGQRLTDLLRPDDVFDRWVIAATGTGKTYFIAQLPGRKVIVCPTLALVENVCREYGAVKFTGATRQQVASVADAEFIATTYSSFRRLSAYLEDRADRRVFIDEAHSFASATSPGFQLKQLHEVLEMARTYKSVTLLTGTYIYVHDPYLRALERLHVDIPRPEKAFRIIAAADVIKTTAEAIKASISAGRFPLVLFNDKKEEGRLGTLQSLLCDIAGIEYFNANEKDNDEFNRVVTAGQIGPDVRGIVTTSVLKEGNNIYNPYHFDIIVVGAFHSAEIEQFAARPRRPASVNIAAVRSDKRKTDRRGFNAHRFAEMLEASAQAVCDELNLQDAKGDTDGYYLEFKARQAIKSNPIRQDNDGRYLVDYLHLSNIVFCQQRTAENRNDELLLDQLGRYGIRAGQHEVDDREMSQAERQEAQQARTEARANKQHEYETVLAELEQDPQAYATAGEKVRQKKLSEPVRAAYKRFLVLHDLAPNKAEIIALLRRVGLKNSEFQLLRKRILIACLQRDAEWMESNRKLPIVLKAIRHAFAAAVENCDRLSSEAIAERIATCLALDKGFDLTYLEETQRADRYLKIARLFYDVERCDSRNEAGEKVTTYKVCTLVFDELFNNNPKTRVQIPTDISAVLQ